MKDEVGISPDERKSQSRFAIHNSEFLIHEVGPAGFEYHPLNGGHEQEVGPAGFEPATKRL